MTIRTYLFMKTVLFLLFFLQLHAQVIIPQQTQQLLLVSALGFKSTQATLQAYEKKDNHWIKIFEPIKVNIGRSGLAWGKGIIEIKHKKSDPVKQEGDGKAPAGLFSLDSFFGYDTQHFDFPYSKMTSQDICVDDSTSPKYNTLLSTRDTGLYKSFEWMKRKDNLYELGIVVGHNKKGLKQAGSCIFIHIQSDIDAPTAGCTSLKKEKLLKIMKWMKFSKHPLLLQLPFHHVLD